MGYLDDYNVMPAPCKHCPFRTDVAPFLTPERAEEIAYLSHNRFATFTCHKTLVEDEEGEDLCAGADSKLCAGFFAMQVSESFNQEPEGYVRPPGIYDDAYEMIQAYEDEWESRHGEGEK